MSKLRFAILGFGHHASRRLVPAFARSTEVSLVGLWRRDQEASAQEARRLNIESFDSAEQLCVSPDVDAVFITSPDAMHLEDARLAFSHGKAVLCEKPVAMNVGQAVAMQEAADAAGALFGVGQNFRFNESLQRMREQIAAGRIGVPQFANALFAYAGDRASRKWITDATLACGGPIADVGVHCIDALRFVLSTEVTSISVLASTDPLSGQVEAFATLQLAMANDAFAQVTVSARASYRTSLEVTGSEGVLIAENGFSVDRPVDLILRKAGEVVEVSTVSNDDGYVRMLDAFSKAFRGVGSFSPSGADAIVNQRILDAAFRSWHSGLRETL